MERSERPDDPGKPPIDKLERSQDRAAEKRPSFMLSWLAARQESAHQARPESFIKTLFRRHVNLEAEHLENPKSHEQAPEVPPPLHVDSEKPAIDPNMMTEPQPTSNKRIAEQVARRVKKYETQNEDPQTILKEMLTAAEIDAPVERIYERRQEVRDEPSEPVSSNGAVSVGSILQQAAPTFSVPDGSATTPLGSPAAVPNTNKQLYRQSIKAGFYAGLFILAIGLLAYLVL